MSLQKNLNELQKPSYKLLLFEYIWFSKTAKVLSWRRRASGLSCFSVTKKEKSKNVENTTDVSHQTL